MKPKLIYNPTAAKGKAGQNLDKVLSLLEERNFAFDLQLTEKIGDALEFSKQAAEAGCPLVIAAGGDGTLNEVINGLMLAELNGNPRPVLAVLPVGRGNDFAFGMDVPDILEEAVNTLIAGKKRCIDIGFVRGGDYPDGRYFGNGIGLGFDTVVGFEANKIKWLHGGAAYMVGLIRTIFKYAHAPVYEVTINGETRQQPFLMVSIMNGRRMGGAFLMAPDGDPGDGLFNLCLVNEVKQIKILPVAAKFISGTQAGHPAVSMEQAKEIHIRAINSTIPAHADGETLCTAGLALNVKIFPKQIELLSRVEGIAA
jgi:YegS/Rv2252/BmrU family lipid kinase